jgi:hypothetical protein
MEEENIVGKMEFYFKEIFGWIKEKDKEYFFIQMVQEYKAIGKTI